ncbi:MAG: twin-arginine translocase subunit TatC [Candidatus Saccharibacteria bacterium]
MAKSSTRHSQPATKLQDHLRELAVRLIVPAIVLVIASVVVYTFYGPILELLRSPLNKELYYSSPSGSFAFVMKICFMGALIITIPTLVYNLIMFIRPAFIKIITRKKVYTVSFVSALLAAAGALFAFFCILPGTLHFFAGFEVSGLSALISADSYLNFVTNIIITFVIMFQLPLLITFIDSITPLPPKKLFKAEKWVILGSLIIALLAPFTYDFVTSILIAVPIIALYNLSILIVILRHRKRPKVRISKPNPKPDPDSVPDEVLGDLLNDTRQPIVTPIRRPMPQNNNRVKSKLISDIRPAKKR